MKYIHVLGDCGEVAEGVFADEGNQPPLTDIQPIYRKKQDFYIHKPRERALLKEMDTDNSSCSVSRARFIAQIMVYKRNRLNVCNHKGGLAME